LSATCHEWKSPGKSRLCACSRRHRTPGTTTIPLYASKWTNSSGRLRRLPVS
jgi:hypothetical protein